MLWKLTVKKYRVSSQYFYRFRVVLRRRDFLRLLPRPRRPPCVLILCENFLNFAMSIARLVRLSSSAIIASNSSRRFIVSVNCFFWLASSSSFLTFCCSNLFCMSSILLSSSFRGLAASSRYTDFFWGWGITRLFRGRLERPDWAASSDNICLYITITNKNPNSKINSLNNK